jgi:hypothetical protein
MDDELRGVKGWLLTFVIIIAVVSPVVSAIQVYHYLYNGPFAYGDGIPVVETVRTFEWALVGISALICWFAAWRLLAIFNWNSVKIAIACIWIVSVGGMIAEFAGLTMILGVDLGELLGATGAGAVIRPFIFGLIWTSYLLKSERVANTYRGNEEQAEVFE